MYKFAQLLTVFSLIGFSQSVFFTFYASSNWKCTSDMEGDTSCEQFVLPKDLACLNFQNNGENISFINTLAGCIVLWENPDCGGEKMTVAVTKGFDCPKNFKTCNKYGKSPKFVRWENETLSISKCPEGATTSVNTGNFMPSSPAPPPHLPTSTTPSPGRPFLPWDYHAILSCYRYVSLSALLGRCSEGGGVLECACACDNATKIPWEPPVNSHADQTLDLCHCPDTRIEVQTQNGPTTRFPGQINNSSFASVNTQNRSCTLYSELNCFETASSSCNQYKIVLNHSHQYNPTSYSRNNIKSVGVNNGCSLLRTTEDALCPYIFREVTLNSSANLYTEYNFGLRAETFSCYCDDNPLTTEEISMDHEIGGVYWAIGVVVVVLLSALVLGVSTPFLIRKRMSQIHNLPVIDQANELPLQTLQPCFTSNCGIVGSRSVQHPYLSQEPRWTSRHFSKLNDVLLGGGAFGQVWAAHNTLENRDVALKQIGVGKALRNLEVDISRLFNEARNVQEIRYKHLVTCYDYWLEGPDGLLDMANVPQMDWTSTNEEFHLFIEMELCHSDLEKWLLNCHKTKLDIPAEDIVKMFTQILKGLGELHSRNIVHRDIKPNNIFYKVEQGKRIFKIGDFGLAKEIGLDWGQQSLSVVGCSLYRSPEMEGRSGYTFKSDVFSLGLVFLEVLCPFINRVKKEKVFNEIRCIETIDFDILSTNLSCKIQPNVVQITKELVPNMVQIDPDLRFDVKDCLNTIKCT